jgi:hypothetical protein
VYDKAEKHWFDPYNLLMSLFTQFSKLCFKVERMINDIYDVLLKKVTISVASGIHVLANGSLSRYLALALAGFMFLLIFLIAAL